MISITVYAQKLPITLPIIKKKQIKIIVNNNSTIKNITLFIKKITQS